MEGRKTRSIKLGRWERRAWGEASPHLPCGSTRNEKPKCHPALGSQNTKLRSRVQGAWYKTREYSAGWPWAWRISSIKHPPDLGSRGMEWLPDPGCRAALRFLKFPLHTDKNRQRASHSCPTSCSIPGTQQGNTLPVLTDHRAVGAAVRE